MKITPENTAQISIAEAFSGNKDWGGTHNVDSFGVRGGGDGGAEAKALQIAQKTTPGTVIDGFTPAQQFFIAWGQARYDATRPETQRLMVQSDPHPVSKFRVIGPLSNLPEFARAFECKPGAAMVRPAEKRCEGW